MFYQPTSRLLPYTFPYLSAELGRTKANRTTTTLFVIRAWRRRPAEDARSNNRSDADDDSAETRDPHVRRLQDRPRRRPDRHRSRRLPRSEAYRPRLLPLVQGRRGDDDRPHRRHRSRGRYRLSAAGARHRRRARQAPGHPRHHLRGRPGDDAEVARRRQPADRARQLRPRRAGRRRGPLGLGDRLPSGLLRPGARRPRSTSTTSPRTAWTPPTAPTSR